MGAVECLLGLAVAGWVKLQLDLAAHRCREGRKEAIVVALRDRVELVVVAASAADGESEHGGANGGELVVHLVVAVLLDLVLGYLRAVNAGGEKAGRLESQV